MTTISAAEANRHFSQVLRQVARGETLIVTSRGKPMATITPITRQAGRSLAKCQLLARLANQPPRRRPLLDARRAVRGSSGAGRARHQHSGFVLAIAARARCRVLLGEDLQPGFIWGGVMVVDPYSATLHPLLEQLLTDEG